MLAFSRWRHYWLTFIAAGELGALKSSLKLTWAAKATISGRRTGIFKVHCLDGIYILLQ